MKPAMLVLLLVLMTGLLGAQTPGKHQVSGSIVIAGRVEEQSLMSLTASQIDIELSLERLDEPFGLQCTVMSRVWWSMMIQSTHFGYVVHQSDPSLKMLYALFIPALQSEPVQLSQPWESPLQPPTPREGMPLQIQIIVDTVSSLLPEGVYTDQLIVSLAHY